MKESRYTKFVALACLIALLIASWGTGAQLNAQEKSFLWKVRSEKNTVYILGSIHFLKKESYPLKKVIEESFETARKLVLEIDLRTIEPEKTQALMLQRGISRDGKMLQQSVSKETYALAAQRAKELGVDILALGALKPWVVALTLTALKLQKLGFDPQYGVDRHFFERAQAANKAIVGLETLEFQLAFFDQMSSKQQESMLLQTLKELDMLDKELDRLVRAWLSGDGEDLEDLMLGGFKEYPELYQRIIFDRNRQWLSQIENFLSQGEVHMVVVGAGHLVGKGSVIELLRQRGYTVEQM